MNVDYTKCTRFFLFSKKKIVNIECKKLICILICNWTFGIYTFTRVVGSFLHRASLWLACYDSLAVLSIAVRSVSSLVEIMIVFREILISNDKQFFYFVLKF